MESTAFQFLVLMVSCWLRRQQAEAIAYLMEENRVLREQLDGRRLRLTDAQRRRLAMKGRELGRKGLFEVATIVTPDTVLRWYRELIAKKYDGSERCGPGRPRTAKRIVELIVTMAQENPRWGYTRIRGSLSNIGHTVGRTTIKRKRLNGDAIDTLRAINI